MWSGFDNRGLYAEVADRASKDIHGNVIHEYYATKEEISHTGGYKIVAELEDGHPKVDDPSEQYIYLYRDPLSTSRDPYTEWIYQEDGNPQWQIIGDTTMAIDGKADKIGGGFTGNIVTVGPGGNIADSGIAATSLVEMGIQDSNSGTAVTSVNKMLVVEPSHEVQLYDGSTKRLDKVYLMTKGEKDKLSSKLEKVFVSNGPSEQPTELAFDPTNKSVTIPLAEPGPDENTWGIAGLVKGTVKTFQ